jgi:hypothetical protein
MKTRKEVRNVGTRDETLTSYRLCPLVGQFPCKSTKIVFKIVKIPHVYRHALNSCTLMVL